MSSEYVVGILRTKPKKPDIMEIESKYGTITPTNNTDVDFSVEQNEEEDKVSPDYQFNPLLGSRTIGLSFVVHGKDPRIKTCFTWGRYEYSKSSKKLFHRNMNFFINEFTLEHEHQLVKPDDRRYTCKRITKKGVEIKLLAKKIGVDKYHVSLFLINNTQYARDKQSVPEWVFQPQIRIKCVNGANLKELDIMKSSNVDEGTDNNILYSDRKNMGRGHLCGIIWKDVDPEDYGVEGFSTFNWPDSKSKYFPEQFVKEFTRPDIRTEFFPTYSILQPEIDDVKNKFNAKELSEIWDPEKLEQKLENIVNEYGKWINEQEKQDGNLTHSTIKTNLGNCKTANARIRAGIRFLKSDEKARLSFCFMNKVIDTKTKWEGVDNFSWREFQLAFILQCLVGVAQKDKSERDLCDILWFPTGGGKTEAYLGITIFAIIFSRLQKYDEYSTNGGVQVISRYTLRLLTIQQFQRAVVAITAADYLRVTKWNPKNMKIIDDDLKEKIQSGNLWGTRRISLGLLIGRSAAPNKFKDAIEKLTGKSDGGEPSQVLNCPCCQTILAIPTTNKIGLDGDSNTIHWIFDSERDLQTLQKIPHSEFSGGDFEVKQGDVRIKQINKISNSKTKFFYDIRISFKKRRTSIIDGKKIKDWWETHISKTLSNNTGLSARLDSTSPDRPGYFFVKEHDARYDFVIYCPNSDCELNTNKIWFENTSDGPKPAIPKPFKIVDEPSNSLFMPIPAFTIDEQVFRRCPSMIISTVDKFAMLPFMEDFATVFGNVDQYDEVYGYGRSEITKYTEDDKHNSNICKMKPFLPPILVIQDELHLIEGPLGSMVGTYEIAFDILSSTNEFKPKYIASSATIEEAKNQVGTIYRRKSFIFPPNGISIKDNYFSRNREDRESKSDQPGRLYLGICAPRNILILPVMIWATILSEVYRIRKNPERYGINDVDVNKLTDPYWTLIGYYNAIKELQIARSLYEDDIKRYVKIKSCERIHTTHSQKKPLTFQPGWRFFPIYIENEIEITTIILYCDNVVGRAVVAVFDNSLDNKPKDMIRKTTQKFQLCTKGENEFELEEKIIMKKGDVLWIAVGNDSKSTKFVVGESQSKIESGFVDIQPEQMDEIFENYNYPTKFLLQNEENTMHISLASKPRNLGPEPVELTGHTESQELPNILKMLSKKSGNDVDVVFTTAVFGTGIDIQRLGLMVVMGQPKTTSTYIQSTGRVGRKNSGLVITWHKATNVRDLNHYENFVGYHRMLQNFVEPISASPFSEESLRLCLGPVLVSILRNSREVSKQWIDNEKGPMRMKQRDQDFNNISDELDKICSQIIKCLEDPNIPSTRRPINAEHRPKIIINRWEKDAKNLSSSGKKLQYREWTKKNPPKNNVVLGTPQHDIQRKTTVFKNVRTSMREIESLANFGYDMYIPGRQIRPSQFVTSYGPGSLIRVGPMQMVIPSLQHIVNDIEKRGISLEKFQIKDNKIEKTVLGILKDTVMQNNNVKIKIFKLPSNADLEELADGDILYQVKPFPKWAICKKHNILKRIKFNNKWILPCSICDKNNIPFNEGVGIRFIRACPKGHMDDIDWNYEVHKNSQCDEDEYVWSEEGSNFEVLCRKCNAKTTYNEIRARSENNYLECSGLWAEKENHDLERCAESAKLVLKNASNLRITQVVSSLIIPPFENQLYRMLCNYDQILTDFSDRDFSKNDVISKFEQKREFFSNIDDNFLSTLKENTEDRIKSTIQNILEELKTGSLSEQQANDKELEQLLEASKNGYPKPFTGEAPDFVVDVNKVKTFYSKIFGVEFVVTPVDTLHVVQVQMGYKREVKTRSVDEIDPYMITTTGELVQTCIEKQNGTNSEKWFVGKKIKGEGIFIHIKNHLIGNSKTESFKSWREASNKYDDETLIRNTDPIFVWWHSFAHRLIVDLSIDSGFQSTAIAEKTYLKKNPVTKEIEAGILLYAVQEGGDGTLGGLTGLVPNFDKIIERSIHRLKHCSNDPLCTERKHNSNRVNGSACHACLLISETSCGLQNKFLDRNLLVESM